MAETPAPAPAADEAKVEVEVKDDDGDEDYVLSNTLTWKHYLGCFLGLVIIIVLPIAFLIIINQPTEADKTIAVSFIAEGTMSDYEEGSAARNSILSGLAATAGVAESDITLEFTSASVLIDATIAMADESAALAGKEALAAAMTDSYAASALLGITIESTPVVASGRDISFMGVPTEDPEPPAPPSPPLPAKPPPPSPSIPPPHIPPIPLVPPPAPPTVPNVPRAPPSTPPSNPAGSSAYGGSTSGGSSYSGSSSSYSGGSSSYSGSSSSYSGSGMGRRMHDDENDGRVANKDARLLGYGYGAAK